jgi:hypothetical protein
MWNEHMNQDWKGKLNLEKIQKWPSSYLHSIIKMLYCNQLVASDYNRVESYKVMCHQTHIAIQHLEVYTYSHVGFQC